MILPVCSWNSCDRQLPYGCTSYISVCNEETNILKIIYFHIEFPIKFGHIWSAWIRCRMLWRVFTSLSQDCYMSYEFELSDDLVFNYLLFPAGRKLWHCRMQLSLLNLHNVQWSVDQTDKSENWKIQFWKAFLLSFYVKIQNLKKNILNVSMGKNPLLLLAHFTLYSTL